MGAKLRKLMARWIDEEKDGILGTKPSPSPQYSEIEEDDEVVEVAPPNEVPKQAPPVDAKEEEETASNLPPSEDEPATITLDEVAPIPLDEAALIHLDEDAPANIEDKEPVANTANDAPPPPRLKLYFHFYC